MDRNSAIGLTLIAALLLAYFYWFAPPPPEPQKPTIQQSAEADKPEPEPETAAESNKGNLTSDSTLRTTYGDLSTFMRGAEEFTALETSDLKITFSNKGATIHELELKNYKTYFGKPLKLVDPTSNGFKLTTQYKGQEVDLNNLFYTVSKTTNGDTTILSFSMRLSEFSELVHTYAIPSKGYKIGYSIKSSGLENSFSDQLALEWKSTLRQLEKDLTDSRNNTTITWYNSGSYDELSQRSTSVEKENLSGTLNWVAIKQKFFLASIISEKGFPGGEVETSVNESDTSVVKRASMKIFIPAKDVADGSANFSLYFGPNDYKKLGTVTEDFAKNVYLGWPPVYWINKYVIFPVFYFLTNVIGNFGIIIVILVILMRILLLPLSYKSYLSMAKMKALKPELDEIKEKFGEDMTKIQQEQMKLYQQVGVNPLSGCIPLLLQMPILFAMFYLFPNSIELRQQSFLWAEDLSTYDSIVNLPFTIPFYGDHVSLFTLLMTISTLVYTWQNNQISSVQGPMKSMSYMMPIIFLFVLNSFPSGLSFYYFITNLVTFGQQAIIKRFVDEGKIKEAMENHRKLMAAGGIKKSKFMSKLEDAMKASEEARRQSSDARKRKKN